MKKMILFLMAFFLIGYANAEIYLWQNQLMNGISSGNPNLNSTVQDHLFYQFEDTSIDGTGKNKYIPVWLKYSIPAMPVVYPNTNIDWCNVTLRHFKNVYDSNGNRINTSVDIQTYYHSSNSSVSGDIYIDVRSDDTLSGDIYCHYTNVSALYETTLPIGRWDTYLPSFECKGCSDYSLESLTNELDTLDERVSDQNQIYSSFQTFIDYNFEAWLIVKWLVSFAFLGITLYLIFYSMYFIYSIFKNIEREI